MKEDSCLPILGEELQLSEEEASELARNLTSQLKSGKNPKADANQIKIMIAGLGDRRGLVRRTITESLGLIGPPALPALRSALLFHSNVFVRRSAAKALKLVGDPTAVPDLLQALKNDLDPVVQASSAAGIAIFGEQAVEGLLEVISNPKSTAMQCGLASWGLAFIGAEASEALCAAAQADNKLIRSAAIAALGEQIQSLNDQAAKDLLLKALNDQSSDIRTEATALIGKLQDSSWAKNLLIHKLDDKSPKVRKSAAISLMRSKDKSIINQLYKRKKEEDDPEIVKVLKATIELLEKAQ